MGEGGDEEGFLNNIYFNKVDIWNTDMHHVGLLLDFTVFV